MRTLIDGRCADRAALTSEEADDDDNADEDCKSFALLLLFLPPLPLCVETDDKAEANGMD